MINSCLALYGRLEEDPGGDPS